MSSIYQLRINKICKLMKRTILIFSILFILIQLGAQNYGIVDPTNRWSYMIYQSWGFWYKQSYYIKFSGDTTINQLNYLKMWESDDELCTDWYLKGYGRTDTNGDIYFRSLTSWEGLAYRFNVNPGDTFTIANPYYPDIFTAEVLEIDTVFIEPINEYRKRIKLSDFDSTTWAEEEYWIEGVGSLAGIINSGFHVHLLTGCEYTTLCQWKNLNLIYSNPDYNSCFYTFVSDSEIASESPEIIIQPNPLIDKSHITLKGFHDNNYHLEITDMFGNIVRKYKIQQDNDFTIHRAKLSSGLYIISLSSRNNIIARKKLIVQ